MNAYDKFQQAYENDYLAQYDVDEVPEGAQCPACKEWRVDALEWDANGEYVTCLTCGQRYVP